MDVTGLILKIYDAVAAIDYGRKGFATRGKAEEGRVSYETGIAWALSVFKDAQSTLDPQAIILVEYTFINQELQYCLYCPSDKAAKHTPFSRHRPHRKSPAQATVC